MKHASIMGNNGCPILPYSDSFNGFEPRTSGSIDCGAEYYLDERECHHEHVLITPPDPWTAQQIFNNQSRPSVAKYS